MALTYRHTVEFSKNKHNTITNHFAVARSRATCSEYIPFGAMSTRTAGRHRTPTHGRPQRAPARRRAVSTPGLALAAVRHRRRYGRPQVDVNEQPRVAWVVRGRPDEAAVVGLTSTPTARPGSVTWWLRPPGDRVQIHHSLVARSAPTRVATAATDRQVTAAAPPPAQPSKHDRPATPPSRQPQVSPHALMNRGP